MYELRFKWKGASNDNNKIMITTKVYWTPELCKELWKFFIYGLPHSIPPQNYSKALIITSILVTGNQGLKFAQEHISNEWGHWIQTQVVWNQSPYFQLFAEPPDFQMTLTLCLLTHPSMVLSYCSSQNCHLWSKKQYQPPCSHYLFPLLPFPLPQASIFIQSVQFPHSLTSRHLLIFL